MKKTDVADFLGSLNAGVFANQIGAALSDVGSGVVEFGKKGKVTITLEMSRVGESNQVNISHRLDYKVPTKRGSRSEDTALDTPMYVTPEGLELFQTNPTAQLFKESETPVHPR
ncbi:hypothetical protein AADU03_004740 [Escherichia coli]|uniref:hypothetical protein n=1 Tax=Pseudomonas sp. 21 TaxID=1619948 RepID=UPI0005EB7A98|nr:hypothetical protein [Pseudomonas sp. 21]KJK03588.1 prophage PssSM-02 [Pseudomonas sp. 21]